MRRVPSASRNRNATTVEAPAIRAGERVPAHRRERSGAWVLDMTTKVLFSRPTSMRDPDDLYDARLLQTAGIIAHTRREGHPLVLISECREKVAEKRLHSTVLPSYSNQAGQIPWTRPSDQGSRHPGCSFRATSGSGIIPLRVQLHATSPRVLTGGPDLAQTCALEHPCSSQRIHRYPARTRKRAPPVRSKRQRYGTGVAPPDPAPDNARTGQRVLATTHGPPENAHQVRSRA